MTAANEAQRQFWDRPEIASFWPRREQLTSAVTPSLLEHARLRSGMRVLDVGCGTGPAALAAARSVGPEGSVSGADIAQVQVDGATRRATQIGADNVRFVVADAQVDLIEGAPFDACVSQFGIMFFEDPVAAFANVRRQTTEGGRMAFACWRDQDLNPWFPGNALARFLPPREAPMPTVGPFAFADAARVREILSDAGWHDLETTPYDLSVTVDADAIVLTDDELAVRGVAAADHPDARRVLEDHFAPLRLHDGRYCVTLAYHVFTGIA